MALKSDPLSSPILKVFSFYTIPSLVGLVAMSSANIVDGIFVGNFVGADALAAINLIFPFLSLLFGLTLMLGVGGSVRAGKYLGEKNPQAASAIFSKTVIVVSGATGVATVLIWIFMEPIFRFMGTTDELMPLLSIYFKILLPFLLPWMVLIPIYFFIRVDNQPTRASVALVVGSILNVILDAWFIAYLDWGLAGAAWATGLSQVAQLLLLATYFLTKDRNLAWMFPQEDWQEIFAGAANGISEFVNEMSGNIIIFMMNWIFILRIGVNGVAAITVINYLIFFGLMISYSVGDSIQLLVSQNLGAKQYVRIKKFLGVALLTVATTGTILAFIVLAFPQTMVGIFLKASDTEALRHALQFIGIVWPVFIFSGINMVLSSYFTGMHRPLESGTIALLKNLILPATFLGLFGWVIPSIPILVALPLAEISTLLLALGLFFKYQTQIPSAKNLSL